MRWFSHRARIFLFAVIAFLVLTVIAIGILRLVNPELNLIEKIGLADDENLTTSRSKPYWTQLTERQRDSLAPLEEAWDTITSARKKKWLEIAQRMESMSPEERARLQERIQLWVNLTPEERKKARQNYLSAKKLEIKDKSLQWLEYQNLPEEEKKELAATARKKRRIVSPKPEEEAPVIQPEPVEETKPPQKEETPEYWR